MQKILRPKELTNLLSISRATLWRMEKRGELPPKIALSPGVKGWRESDISEWLEAREILPEGYCCPETQCDKS